jgi:hypothetical protein
MCLRLPLILSCLEVDKGTFLPLALSLCSFYNESIESKKKDLQVVGNCSSITFSSDLSKSSCAALSSFGVAPLRRTPLPGTGKFILRHSLKFISSQFLIASE